MGNPVYDLVLFGATGFTGRRTAAYLDRVVGGRRWAVAGRSAAKLEQLCGELGGPAGPPGVVVADASDPASIDRMVQSARVVITTAGPFAEYGPPVVDACVRHGVDYVDLTGETPFVRRMIDLHHEEAARRGVRIVHCTGFDSVPSDMGTWMLVDHLRRERGVGCRGVRAYYEVGGSVSGGTVASGIGMLERGEFAATQDPYLLNPTGTAPERPMPDRRGARFDADIGAWTAPFVMAYVNTRIVRRSAALYAQWGDPYGAGFDYQEVWRMGRRMGAVKAWGRAAVQAVAPALRFGVVRALVRPILPAPGEGPSDVERGGFRCTLLGEGEDGSRVRGEVSGRGDPGYKLTVIMQSEAALCLLEDRAELPGGQLRGERRGGVLTPATALGAPYLERLRAAGLTFTVTP